ncbi:hypothetical protein BDV95DRAFT_569571 [Massariosphaeria phaeospora]|uniref:Uncharacterized protein n=1 Tax=Massariosphaeria phaeospora TaxID=100035 RepID=A0A7C8I733_9PLEO|nr:hypothetical protein BDV95DRAFT_569571 [Massariosphaeria phaeospora]
MSDLQRFLGEYAALLTVQCSVPCILWLAFASFWSCSSGVAAVLRDRTALPIAIPRSMSWTNARARGEFRAPDRMQSLAMRGIFVFQTRNSRLRSHSAEYRCRNAPLSRRTSSCHSHPTRP